MSELASIADTLGTSVPVFRITADTNGELDFILKNPYTPSKSGDPVHDLVVDHWRETLDKRQGRFIAQVNVQGVYTNILVQIKEVMLNTSPLKNPKQSILYKWLSDQNTNTTGYNGPLSVGFIALYRYIINNGISETRDKENPHTKNVLAILELMREKYEV